MAKGDVFAEDLVSVTNIYKSLVFDYKEIQKIEKKNINLPSSASNPVHTSAPAQC